MAERRSFPIMWLTADATITDRKGRTECWPDLSPLLRCDLATRRGQLDRLFFFLRLANETCRPIQAWHVCHYEGIAKFRAALLAEEEPQVT